MTMASYHPQDILAKVPEDRQLTVIANNIGSNWEMLAAYLFVDGSTVVVDQLVGEHQRSSMRVYYLLLRWRSEAEDATLRALFGKMQKCGPLNVTWVKIAKELGVSVEDILACKEM
ncbi:uncharacterized protein LOC123534258 [Mercenaria mercenaria]|uniref:uncharacterized protein LOC123534258 n=1 Tax=Mercenaria mercenaria TaxID=6596 RepID=UPI00234F9029|nr:uncharacterized protein LOC123534258 [Mercenaria mercenaria]XP_053375943.1 uncharacterized protein LOC123534258 [Mercenaria mercenaria]